MSTDSRKNQDEENKLPPADTGNASNPSPRNTEMEPQPNQLIDKKGENYLREVANIEDEPDAQDQQEADKTFEEAAE